MPDKRNSRRRYSYYNPIVGHQSHPFLTDNGLRLQQQGARTESALPYSVSAESFVPPPQLLTAAERHALPLQNVLPSRKFPDVRVLDRTPLTSFCSSRLVPSGSNPQLQAIGKLQISLSHLPQGESASGSAWITGPSTIATSAHNLFDVSKRQWSQSVEFLPGHNHYGKQRYPSCHITACSIPKNYFNNPSTNNDIAICHVDRNIGDIVGQQITMRTIYDNNVFQENPVVVVGYPAGSGFDFGKQLWVSKGEYLFGRRNGPNDDFAPALASDFGGGCSGCPWLLREPNGRYVAVGASSGHARLYQVMGEPNLMSLMSPFFGPKMFSALQSDAVFHQFDQSTHG